MKIVKKSKTPNSGDLQVLAAEMSEIRNYLIDRSSLIAYQSRKHRRNVDYECQYPARNSVTVADYNDEYENNGVATRVVNVKSNESWRTPPEYYETERAKQTKAEQVWNDLEEKLSLYAECQNVDEISGIGSFGLLFLGFDDGAGFDTPVARVNRYGEEVSVNGGDRELLYVRSFDETNVTVAEWNTKKGPRYGQPEIYEINFFDASANNKQTVSGKVVNVKRKVHWSRVIHVADNAKKNPFFGMPRQKNVYNWELDIRKVAGASAEGYWQAGSPAYSIEEIPEMAKFGGVKLDYDTIKAEMRKLKDGLQKFIALESMTTKSLAPQAVSPADHLMALLQLVTLTIDVPMRIFMGSEVGKLASDQDAKRNNGNMMHRRRVHNEAKILRPLNNRLTVVGTLPKTAKDKYFFYWNDLNTPTDKDRAEIGMKKSTALMNYLIGGISKIMSPVRFFTSVMGMPQEEAEVAVAEAKKYGVVMPPQQPVQGKPKTAMGGKATPAGGSLNGRTGR